ncbi:hypothetical protein [Amycolatopsis nigrescens]|uniref:hypothetical protein n=1 Tax=Amycolatopsis nigrescens TaxID=381445 RepID=UPI00036B8849|nr:hypothetical protein [Amycolatopsis nigrescens]
MVDREVTPLQHHDLAKRRALSSPFMVVGRINGRHEAAGVATPADALDRMLRWLECDDDASAVWYLREDWPDPITIIGRLAPGSCGETRRAAHLFSMEPGAVHCGSLEARCGTELFMPEIEWLNVGTGMPCERCLALSNTPAYRLEAESA